MLSMKPIPVIGEVIPNKNAISSDEKYIACITNNFFGKKLTIVDTKKIYYAHKKPKHFQYRFPFNTKVYNMHFNASNNKLYCITQKSQCPKIYQFELVATNNQAEDNTWKEQQSLSVPNVAQCYFMDDINNKLSLVYIEQQKIINQIIDLNKGEITIKNLEIVASEITQIHYDAKNKLIYTCVKNKSLYVLQQQNDTWELKNIVCDCPNLPVCYSEDGTVLVFIDNSRVKIISLSINENDLTSKYIDLNNSGYKKTEIKNIAMNPAGNEITFFIYCTSKYKADLIVGVMKKNNLDWSLQQNYFYVCASNSLACDWFDNATAYYLNNIYRIVFINHKRLNFYFGTPRTELQIPGREKLTRIRNSIIEYNSLMAEYERKEALANATSRGTSTTTNLFSGSWLTSNSSYGCSSTCDYSSTCDCD